MGEQIETCVLFSDIRDFTEYTAKKGDQQAFDLLQAHHTIAETRIRKHEGQLLKTYGDGMMACFEHSVQATSAAIDMQQAFNAHTQQQPHQPLLVGMGLNQGQVITDEKDLFGHTVNLAKRLADEALSSQILASKTIIESLHSVRASVRWQDLGAREIKGIGQEKLYEVIWRPEVARLTTTDETLILVLTEDNKLVIELSKRVQSELAQVRERLRKKSEKHTGLSRWFIKRLETWVPQVIDRALLGAGVGIEHTIQKVEMSMKRGNLDIRIANRLPFTIDEVQLDPKEVEKFVQIVAARKRTKNSAGQ